VTAVGDLGALFGLQALGLAHALDLSGDLALAAVTRSMPALTIT
jgi:hypothetical protein